MAMSAGQVWRRANGLRWVEVQAEPMEPSGWRIMVPLVELDDAPDAPPLVVTVEGVRARVHLLTSVPDNDLGEPAGSLSAEDVDVLQAAARALLTGSGHKAERDRKLAVLDAMAEAEADLGIR